MGNQNMYRCNGCGAQLTDGMKGGKITCKYCGTVNVIQFNIMKDNMLVCPNCGAANDLHAEYCAECGDGLYLICPKCKTKNKADAAHCIQCGSLLGEEIKLRNLYFEYLKEVKRLKKTLHNKMIPWWLSLIPTVFALVMNVVEPGGLEVFAISTFTFSIPAMILLPIGKKFVMNKVRKEAEILNSTRIGFSEFFELALQKNYWPDTMVEGEKHERFISIAKK